MCLRFVFLLITQLTGWLRLSRRKETWTKLRWPYERADMVDQLRKVAGYRNAIAHWDIDAPGHGSHELTHAKQVLRLLKVIDRDPAWSRPDGHLCCVRHE
jgi:hypothetical protein